MESLENVSFRFGDISIQFYPRIRATQQKIRKEVRIYSFPQLMSNNSWIVRELCIRHLSSGYQNLGLFLNTANLAILIIDASSVAVESSLAEFCRVVYFIQKWSI